MKRFLSLLLVVLLLSSCDMQYATPPVSATNTPVGQDFFTMPTPTAESPMTSTDTPLPSMPLHRVINFGNMLEAPNEGEWGLTVQEEYFDRVKEAGFDFIRLPVRWSTHAQQEAPYTIDPAFLSSPRTPLPARASPRRWW